MSENSIIEFEFKEETIDLTIEASPENMAFAIAALLAKLSETSEIKQRIIMESILATNEEIENKNPEFFSSK